MFHRSLLLEEYVEGENFPTAGSLQEFLSH